MAEQFAQRGDVVLCFETLGANELPADAPTVVLVMGLGLGMLWWRDDFCRALVTRGMRVVRFDNRDVGHSTHFHGAGPSGWQYLRRRAPVSYSLEDMADDCAAVIGHVAPHGAHVVGVSLGSFIAQAVAIRYADRVRSLVSIMGRPGDGRTGKTSRRMSLRTMVSAFAAPSRDPVEAMIAAFDRIGSTGRTAEDERDVRTIMARSLVRDGDDSGSGRQLAAIFAESDRTPGLRAVRAPTLVVHGDHDQVILPSGGRATAAAVPGAEMMLLPGMGHDLARRLWPEILDGIERTVRRAGWR